jgi:putative oxidoreductase
MKLPDPALRVDAGLLVLRLALGVILLIHGIWKVKHGVAWISGPLSALGLPSALAYGAYIGEVLAPVLLIFGLWPRASALVIAFHMFSAIVLARRGDIGKINPMSGGWSIELEALLIFAAIAIALAGAGRYRLSPMRRGVSL